MGFVADKLLKVFESIVLWIFESFIEPFLKIPTLKNLVFGKAGEESLVWGTFSSSELTDGLGPLYFTMTVLAGFFFIGFIVLYGMRIAGAPLNPSKRLEVIEFLKDLVLVGIVIMNLPTIYDLIFSVNMAIVNLFSSAYDSQSMGAMEGIGTSFIEDDPLGILGIIFIQLILLGLMLWANFYYMMRKLTLIILMALGPLMIIFWLHPQFKPMTGAWLKEMIGSVFVQSIHALVFWTIAIVSTSQEGIVAPVILYLVFIPISESIRRLLMMGGDMQGGLSKAGSMMGMAGLAGMYGAAKGALNGKGVAGTLRGAYEGTKDSPLGGKGEGEGLKNTMGGSAGGDDGTTTRADKMLRAGDIVGRMGKATLGMAGAVAGSGLGPVGAMAGATGGFAIGGVVGGVAGRLGTGAVHGIADRFGKGMDGVNALKDGQSRGFDEDLANESADRETASWADSNKADTMNSLRERFPDASDSELDSKFDNIKANKRAGFYDEAQGNIRSAREYGSDKASGDNMVNTSSTAMADQWEANNKDAFLADYDKTNPQTASETSGQFNQRRQQALDNKKGEMKDSFAKVGNEYVAKQAADGSEPISKEDFSNYMSGAGADIVANDSGTKALTAKRAATMATQWEIENGESFLSDYDTKNPILPGETQDEFGARRQSSLSAKKSQMQEMYSGSIDSNNAKSIASANSGAISHVQGEQVSDGKGKPNTQFLASSLANTKTVQMGDDFVAQQVDQGVSKEAARQDWNANHKESAHTGNLATYNDSVQQASETSFGKGASNKGFTRTLGAFVGGATGATALATTFRSAAQASAATHMAYSDDESGAVSNIMRTAGPSLNAGWQGAITSIADQSGSAVQAHANHQNAAGYGTGLLFGVGGYKTAKSAANRFSPFRQQAQSEIHSPGEVIQMAQTTTDEHGNTKVAPGAIRQVTTADSSYIEVRTKGGENKVVSRMGSGHSGLNKGDVVYQDLSAEGNQLVAAKSGGGQSSTYRVDSAGAHIPSSVSIDSAPSTLLGNPRISEAHRAKNRQEMPVYSQAVDSGGFFTNDLADNGFENVQVMIEKDKQFVTAEKSGETYRVSQVFSGDSRLGNESVSIPLEVNNGKLYANRSGNSSVAVESIIRTADNNGGHTVQENIPYFSTNSAEGLINNLDDMMDSKYTARTKHVIEQRKRVDQQRRKQGLMG